MKSDYSASVFQRSQKVIPGGVNSPVRSFRGVGGGPVVITRGRGPRVWDVDGNEYIDYLASWGPLIAGHAHPRVVLAVGQAAAKGTSFGAPTLGELELAELITQAMPSLEMLRLVNSGTEAAMSAIRLARAFTGRSKIVKFAGCYHGHSDPLLVKAGSGAATHGVPDSAGVPEAYAQETLVADYNDVSSVKAYFDEWPGQIAAVIVEPVAGNMGVVPPEDGFLQGLRKVTEDNGALLIFDEVITGFRVAFGGAQALYGVSPDLTCLGKIIGGGLPVGAYSGRRDIMEQVSPLGPMYQAGTLSGNPIAVAAGIETLKLLQEPNVYEQLEAHSASLANGLLASASAAGLPATLNRVGSVMTLFFNPGPVRTWDDVAASDTKRYAQYFHGMLDRGVYLAPSAFEASFVSTLHTPDDIEQTIDNAAEVMRGLS